MNTNGSLECDIFDSSFNTKKSYPKHKLTSERIKQIEYYLNKAEAEDKAGDKTESTNKAKNFARTKGKAEDKAESITKGKIFFN